MSQSPIPTLLESILDAAREYGIEEKYREALTVIDQTTPDITREKLLAIKAEVEAIVEHNEEEQRKADEVAEAELDVRMGLCIDCGD